jgi:hypothetical protein
MIEKRRVDDRGLIRKGEERRATVKRQANHTERSVTYLHVMARIGLDNEIKQPSCHRRMDLTRDYAEPIDEAIKDSI